MAHETATLAAYVVNLKYQDIPAEVLDRAKVLTLDFLGSAIRARREAESTPSMLKMLEALALDAKGESTVFRDSKTWTPAVAALLNGALGHSLDFDDTHADSSLHPSAPLSRAATAGVQVLLSPNTVDSPLPSSASASNIPSSDAVDSASRRARIALPRKSRVSTLARSSTSGGMSANLRSAT